MERLTTKNARQILKCMYKTSTTVHIQTDGRIPTIIIIDPNQGKASLLILVTAQWNFTNIHITLRQDYMTMSIFLTPDL